MFTRRRCALGSLLAVVGIAAAFLVFSTGAFATHTPADKVVAAGSTLMVMGPGAAVPILKATLRTSKPTDLILTVSLECSIFTRLVTGPSGSGGSDTATASGDIRIWIEIDGQVVPVNSMSQPPQSTPPPGNVARDGVTFCNRTYSRTVRDAENPLDGQDVEDDFIDTKNSNAFNWLRLNLGSDVHTIVVKATLSESAPTADSTAEAVIGNRSLIVIPSKLANDATI